MSDRKVTQGMVQYARNQQLIIREYWRAGTITLEEAVTGCNAYSDWLGIAQVNIISFLTKPR